MKREKVIKQILLHEYYTRAAAMYYEPDRETQCFSENEAWARARYLCKKNRESNPEYSADVIVKYVKKSEND